MPRMSTGDRVRCSAFGVLVLRSRFSRTRTKNPERRTRTRTRAPNAERRTPNLRRWLPVALVMGLVVAVRGQQPPTAEPPKTNPYLGNREAIRSGMTMYRVRCADCHGLDAKGYRGPDLTALLAGEMTDEKLFTTIRKGVPGTDMPGSQAADDELLLVIAYLRNVSA